jgi:hypothetical protein
MKEKEKNCLEKGGGERDLGYYILIKQKKTMIDVIRFVLEIIIQ